MAFCAVVKLLDWGEEGMATTAETAALRASFRQEVAVWHQLDHPNVTKVYSQVLSFSNVSIVNLMKISISFAKLLSYLYNCSLIFFAVIYYWNSYCFFTFFFLLLSIAFFLKYTTFMFCSLLVLQWELQILRFLPKPLHLQVMV